MVAKIVFLDGPQGLAANARANAVKRMPEQYLLANTEHPRRALVARKCHPGIDHHESRQEPESTPDRICLERLASPGRSEVFVARVALS